MEDFVRRIAGSVNPEHLPGSHLTDEARAQLAFAMINNWQSDARKLVSASAEKE